MENLTINLKPVGFRSPFQFSGEVYNVEGEFRANSEKEIISIAGTVKIGDGFKATFNGEKAPEAGLRYSISSISDLEEVGAIGDFLADVINNIVARLNEE